MALCNKIVNKRGSSMGFWTEGALFSVAIISLMLIIFSGMNALYDKNYDGGFGFTTNETMDSFNSLQDTLDEGVRSGEGGSTGNTGIELSTAWGMILATTDAVWGFATGRWIETAFDIIKFPMILAKILRILFVISIGFILLKLVLGRADT